MKFIKFNPKRFFPSKQRSKPSRSDPSSFGSSSDVTSETKNPYSHVELLKAFKLIDKDNDGAVSRHDLESFLSQLGPNPPNEDEINVMLREVDRDGHGTISLETLASLVVFSSDDSSTHGSTELKETFEFFDSDRDGLISAEELLRVFAAAIGDDRCTLEECRRMIAAVDEDGDGFVSFNEFSRMMMDLPNL